MISKQHKTIFVHVPKVAGQSIERMFLDDLGLSWETRDRLLLRRKGKGELGPERLAHLTAKDYVKFGFISEEEFKTFFKFSFVRNPYKRAFSFYNFLGYSRIISFRTFVFSVLPKKLKKNDFFFLSQYDYLHDEKGTLLVDFVGHLETIKMDIEEIKKQCGLKQPLPHANKSKGEWKRALGLLVREPYLWTKISFGQGGRSYEEVMTDSLKSKIYELYQKDFDAFNFEK